MTKRALLFFFLCGLIRADRIDDIVKTEMAAQHIPGLALAVMKDGQMVRSGGYGLANIEVNAPVTTRTVFKIGSVSKQFIASGLMLLVQDGKVSLDDSVQKHIPDAPPTWHPITLRRLASHTAGLVREGPAFDPLRAQPDIAVISSAYPLPLLFAPGDQWRYSNVGFFSIAEIITRISGEPWQTFLDERIFRPLKMAATRTTTWQEVIPNRAEGYVYADGKTRRALEYLAVRPSGAFLSTVEDYAKWDAALYTDTPLTKASRDQMWTAVPLNDQSSSAYGLGWEVQVRAGKRSVHHGGSLPGFRAYVARFPDDRLSFVVLTNGEPAKLQDVLWKVAAVWLPGVDQAPASGRVGARPAARPQGSLAFPLLKFIFFGC